MNIEDFVIDLLYDIRKAVKNNENYDLHMEAPYVAEVAEAYDKVKHLEIY